MPSALGSTPLGSTPLGATPLASSPKASAAVSGYVIPITAMGAFSWIVPATGLYRIAQWAAGGIGNPTSGTNVGGGGGELAVSDKWLVQGTTVTGTVGANTSTDGQDTTVVLPSGVTITVKGGKSGDNGGTGGTGGSNGDVHVSGSNASGANGGQAGSYLTFTGGLGDTGGTPTGGRWPGGGGKGSTGTGQTPAAAGGVIIGRLA